MAENKKGYQIKVPVYVSEKMERDIVRKTFVDIDGLRTSVYASLIRYLP